MLHYAFSEKKIIFFDIDIVVKKQIEMWFKVVCTLINKEYMSSKWSKCCGLTQLCHCDEAYSLLIRVETMLNHKNHNTFREETSIELVEI